MSEAKNLTTILSLALMILLVIPIWYSLGLLKPAESFEAHGHGEDEDGGPSPDEFIELVSHYIKEYTREDGCVVPADKPINMGGHVDTEGLITNHARINKYLLARLDISGSSESNNEKSDTDQDVKYVYIYAYQFGYRPSKICLKAGEQYRFVMMSIDVVHGASIQLDKGSLMIRLNPGQIVESTLSFTEPGEYLLYCTYFCGVGHDQMYAKIIVEGDHHG